MTLFKSDPMVCPFLRRGQHVTACDVANKFQLETTSVTNKYFVEGLFSSVFRGRLELLTKVELQQIYKVEVFLMHINYIDLYSKTT